MYTIIIGKSEISASQASGRNLEPYISNRPELVIVCSGNVPLSLSMPNIKPVTRTQGLLGR